MADKAVAIAVDPVKQRLRAVKVKFAGKEAGKNTLTQKELEDTLEDILSLLKVD